MPDYLKKWLALPSKHKFVICRLWGAYIYWHCVIEYLPFRLWKHHIIDNSSKSPDMPLHKVDESEIVEDIKEKKARQLIQLSESVGRNHFVKVNCLRRCMVQKSLLNRLGINSQLTIGVKKSQKIFAAHCWLTYQNRIINDTQNNTNEYIALEKITSQNVSVFKHK